MVNLLNKIALVSNIYYDVTIFMKTVGTNHSSITSFNFEDLKECMAGSH